MKKKYILTVFIFFLLILYGSGNNQAKTITVTTTQDSVAGSLRAAINTANTNNEDDVIHLPAGTYFLEGAPGDDENSGGDLDIDTTGKITIIGAGVELTIIDGNHKDRVLHIQRGIISISGVTIRKGRLKNGDANNINSEPGGGIRNNGQLSLTGCLITNNVTGAGFNGCGTETGDCGSGGNGGGIYNTGILTLTNCVIDYNLTGNSGGGYVGHLAGHGGHGGGIYNHGTQNLTDCTISNNITGAGIWEYCDPLERAGNDGGDGGGIYNNGIQSLNGCSINGNATGSYGWPGDNGRGGGIFHSSGQGTITACIITDNEGKGGGLYNNGTLTLTGCTIAYNIGDNGGGIWNSSDTGGTGELTVSRCTIHNNNAKDGSYNINGGDGGGIYNSSTLSLSNCTISGNAGGDSGVHATGGNGGGIYTCNGISNGMLTLTGCTVCLNKSGGKHSSGLQPGSGGGIYKLNGTVIIKNTIAANNQAAEGGEGPDCFGVIDSQGYNLIENTAGCSIVGNTTGNITGVDPLLDSLSYNGGTTQTHALLPGSPALDAGCSFGSTADQRGYTRPVDVPGIPNANDGSDIGAYEAIASCTISGQVTYNGGGIPGVVLTFSNNGGTTATDTEGKYSQTVPFGWSGTAAPAKAGYDFMPASRIYANVNENQADQDYTAYAGEPPHISLNRTRLYFGYETGGDQTSSQAFMITNSGGGILNWSVSRNVNWLNYNPTSGTGPGLVTVSITPAGLTPGTYTGIIAVTDPNAANSPQTVTVTLTIYKAGAANPPFGVFDTPEDGSTVMSSIPVTGWAIDDIGIENVKIFRKAISGEGSGMIYIGDAVLVEGARPDIEAAYPGYPGNYKAGWGYMLLTNAFPNQGNGTFTLYAKVVDAEGNEVTLGTKTIQCDNAHAVKPFGAIDTPPQGGTATGSNYINFGWALTPQPNTIPKDGKTITVWVDGVSKGHPVYNKYRQDIAALFPGYNNSGGAGGNFTLDTTAYTNGVHTIAWSVKDNAGNTDGIGSRYFTVQNTGGDTGQATQNTGRSVPLSPLLYMPSLSQISHISPNDAIPLIKNSSPVRVRKGYNTTSEMLTLFPDENGIINIDLHQLERIEIHLPGSSGELPESKSTDEYESPVWYGCQVVQVNGNEIRPLPSGSTFDPVKGVFYWQPGPAAFGSYEFVFLASSRRGEMSSTFINLRIQPLPGKNKNNF